MVEHEGTSWYVLEFLDGMYFSGARDEITPVGQLMGGLRRILESCPAEVRPHARIQTVGDLECSLAGEIRRARASWGERFDTGTAELLNGYWPEIEAALEEAAAEAKHMADGIMHIDLHPHNLLIEGRRPVVLDFDSFQFCAPDVMVAFAYFKLLRQCVVAAAGGLRELPELRDALLFSSGLPVSSAEGLLARMEVVRRMFIVLRLNLHENDRRWNHVMPMHLAALKESKILFPS